jgi:hypothetical protein
MCACKQFAGQERSRHCRSKTEPASGIYRWNTVYLDSRDGYFEDHPSVARQLFTIVLTIVFTMSLPSAYIVLTNGFEAIGDHPVLQLAALGLLFLLYAQVAEMCIGLVPTYVRNTPPNTINPY